MPIKFYNRNPYPGIDWVFIDRRESTAKIQYEHEHVQNALNVIPQHYETYEITYKLKDYESVSGEHINTILQWKNAENLRFYGDNGFIVKALQQRMPEFTQLNKLEELVFSYHVQGYVQINVRGFIDNLPNLKKISFRHKTLLDDTSNQGRFFSQQTPSNWSFKDEGRGYFALTKKRA